MLNDLQKTAYIEAPALAKQILQEMKDGVRESGIDWADDLKSNKLTIQEMIGTADGSKEFIEKTTFDVFQGRENIPLLYKPFYRTQTDANFPKTMTMEEFGPVEVVFLEKLENGEVKFGSLGPGTEKTVSFKTYAAGIEYNEDIIEYNQTWRVSDISLAFGEAYNKLLNHLHLSPIINGSYVATGSDLADQKEAQTAGTAQLIEFDTDIATTLRSALSVLPKGSLILANSFDAYRLEDALAGSMLADASPSVVKRRLSMENVVYYDGDSVTVGEKTYEYPGVTPGEIFLVVPGGRNFREYIKHDLRVDSGDGDLSRLILTQIVGRARRAVAVVLGEQFGAVKIELETDG